MPGFFIYPTSSKATTKLFLNSNFNWSNILRLAADNLPNRSGSYGVWPATSFRAAVRLIKFSVRPQSCSCGEIIFLHPMSSPDPRDQPVESFLSNIGYFNVRIYGGLVAPSVRFWEVISPKSYLEIQTPLNHKLCINHSLGFNCMVPHRFISSFHWKLWKGCGENSPHPFLGGKVPLNSIKHQEKDKIILYSNNIIRV